MLMMMRKFYLVMFESMVMMVMNNEIHFLVHFSSDDLSRDHRDHYSYVLVINNSMDYSSDDYYYNHLRMIDVDLFVHQHHLHWRYEDVVDHSHHHQKDHLVDYCQPDNIVNSLSRKAINLDLTEEEQIELTTGILIE